MKRSVLVYFAAAVMAAWAAVSAAADGGPSPAVSFGWNGVLAPGHEVRYVAIPSRDGTVVEAVRVLGGRVVRWNTLPGAFGIPNVAWVGSASGLSADGKTLVLASQAPRAIHGTTRFVLLKTRTLRAAPMIALRGSYSFDALSPDASTLYLIQYTSGQDYTRYRVRAYDLTKRQLVPGAIVDRREPDEAMTGGAVTRATTPDGRWAYTLYARDGQAPFVHALDTVQRRAYCIDLPLPANQQWQMTLRLAFHGPSELRVRAGHKTLALVDLEQLEARKATDDT
jgi:hypothetical protein